MVSYSHVGRPLGCLLVDGLARRWLIIGCQIENIRFHARYLMAYVQIRASIKVNDGPRLVLPRLRPYLLLVEHFSDLMRTLLIYISSSSCSLCRSGIFVLAAGVEVAGI